jgi:uncharacterized RDD family membrane protein YckC
MICFVFFLLITAFTLSKDIILGRDLSTLATIEWATDQYGTGISAYLATLDWLISRFGWLTATIYFVSQWSSSKQATPGMRIMGVKMVGYDYKRISFTRAFGRYLAMFLSGLTLGIGYFMIAFTKRKQALHDMIAKTYVIRT